LQRTELITNKSSMNIKDTKEFVETLIECGGRDCQHETLEDHYIILKEDIIQDRTKLIEEVIQWHKERYSKNILNKKQHGQAYRNEEYENNGWNSATQDTIETLTKLKE